MSARILLIGAAAILLCGCNGNGERHYQGWVEADLLFIGPDEPGRIETAAVREGDTVAAEAPLFTVDSDLQRADLRAAEASVEEARARLARLEAAQQRPAEVAVLEAQQQRAEAALELSSGELARQKVLAERGFTPKAQLDTAQANFNRDRAALEEVRRQILVAKMSSREEDIAAARQTLQMNEAKRAAATTRLQRRTLLSPAAGTVQQVYFRAGEMVAAGRPVLALLPPGNLKIRFFVPEPVLPRVALGDAVQVRCDGCRGDITARIAFIARTAEYTPPVIYSLEERAKLVFLVEARPTEVEFLRVGQPVSVALRGGEARR